MIVTLRQCGWLLPFVCVACWRKYEMCAGERLQFEKYFQNVFKELPGSLDRWNITSNSCEKAHPVRTKNAHYKTNARK